MLMSRITPFLVILAVVVWSAHPVGGAMEERLGLEFLFALRGPIDPPDDVVVVAITRNSARALGLSEKLHEWNRQPYADLTRSLKTLGARSIAYDVFFEAERHAGSDTEFQNAITEAGNVLLFARSTRDSIGDAHLEKLEQPLLQFRQAAQGTAPLVLPKVPARVSRFFVRHPSFSDIPTLHGLTWVLQQDDRAYGMQALMALPASLPLNLYGPPRTIRTVEFSDLITQPDVLAADIKGATVFVGYSAEDQPDQQDGFYTAFTRKDGLDISGVELAATAFANLSTGIWLRELLPWQSGLLVFVLGWAVFLCARYLPPLSAGAVLLGFVCLITIAAHVLFSHFYVWFPWFNSVVVTLPLCGGLGIWLRNRELFQQKGRLQWAFGKYLPPDELNRLVAEKGLPALRDYHNSVCLVTDAQGYSRLSESLSPVELAELMQDYYQAIIPPIRKAGGIISDVAGDGVIALWLHLDQHGAWQALKSVVDEISINVQRFNAAHPGNELPTRIGIHAGEIVLGHFGAMDHHEFRAMGDIINTTSRLEGANKQLGTDVLISETCIDRTDESIRYLGRFRFVGKANPLRLYTVKQTPDPVLLKQYQLAILKFEAGHIQAALKLFKSIARYYPEDGPTELLVQLLSNIASADNAELLKPDGIIVLEEK
ncbi:hypothetical protein Kalk_05015 [Ketobacter alkanivorans]|uniref:Guanylate cyclase domain-containing protein n=2 Tax=Ketobacter alkanivorans TaxID=1917421 RepID=A0A2K9LHI9_9GAMM|nr:hypothetical protein Kalk_05015 [Ketobacter alkanivorans]